MKDYWHNRDTLNLVEITNIAIDRNHVLEPGDLLLLFLFQELEEILTDVTSAVSEAICQEGEIVTDKVSTDISDGLILRGNVKVLGNVNACLCWKRKFC